MKSRLVHIGTSLAIVVAAYWVYALVAVPVIEPPAESPRQSEGSGSDVPPPPSITKHLAGLFPPGSWVFSDPKVLLGQNALLLMQKYDSLGGGWVDLCPLVVLFLPEDENLEFPERVQRAMILEAPQGAKVRFDQPVSLARLRIGRPVEGKLRGPVTLRRRGRRADHADDLLVHSREIELNEQRIWTAQEVDFSWGRSYGKGRQMEIRLRPGEGPAPKSHSGPNVGGIEQFEVQVLEKLHLEPAEKETLETAQASASPPLPTMPTNAARRCPTVPGEGTKPARGPGALGTGASGPIEVTCRGPFHFHVVRQVATFRDQVELVRIRTPAPNDQVHCELLSIFFSQAQSAAKPGGNSAEAAQRRNLGFDLEARRFVAEGHPATVRAPADKVFVRGEHLEYDLKTGIMVLVDPKEAVLQQGPKEIHTANLRYEPAAEPGHLGQALAKGPGWVRGLMTDRPDQPFAAQWLEQMEIRPEGKYHRLSLLGGASIRSESTGKLDARRIHFWLAPAAPLAASRSAETPPGGRGQGQLRPDRMLAEGDVRSDSPQLSSAVDRLEVYFTAASPAPGPQPATPGPQPTAHSPPPTAPGQAPAAAGHMHVEGQRLVAHMLLDDQQHAALTAVTVEGRVRCTETQTAVPGEQPVLISGERLDVTDANLPAAQGLVTGTVPASPAHFEGRGISLTSSNPAGSNIHFHRGQNRVWIEGPGWMLVPMDKDLDGRPLERPVPLRVDWRRRMEFDGLTAHFEEQVKATGPAQQLQTPVMDVRFQRPLVFTQPRPQQPPQVETISCGGGVFMESRAFEGDVQIAFDRMEVPDLTVNLLSGVLRAGGPGWLISVRRGTAALGPGIGKPPGARVTTAAKPPAAVPAGFAATPAATAKPPAAQLMGLHLRYLGSITGNVLAKEMTFHDQVRSAYAPVQSWLATLESDNPQLLGPNAVVVHSDHLTVVDMGPPGHPAAPAGPNGGRHAELLAAGNAIAEGSTLTDKQTLVSYTARATRMDYSQFKDLVVLEGDGRTDAELFREEHVGSQPAYLAAQKILYWPQQNRTSIEGARALNLNQMPGAQWQQGAKLPGAAAKPPPLNPGR